MGPDTLVRMCGIRNDHEKATSATRASSCTRFQRDNPFHLLLYVSVLQDKLQRIAACLIVSTIEMPAYSVARHFGRNSGLTSGVPLLPGVTDLQAWSATSRYLIEKRFGLVEFALALNICSRAGI